MSPVRSDQVNSIIIVTNTPYITKMARKRQMFTRTVTECEDPERKASNLFHLWTSNCFVSDSHIGGYSKVRTVMQCVYRSSLKIDTGAKKLAFVFQTCFYAMSVFQLHIRGTNETVKLCNFSQSNTSHQASSEARLLFNVARLRRAAAVGRNAVRLRCPGRPWLPHLAHLPKGPLPFF